MNSILFLNVIYIKTNGNFLLNHIIDVDIVCLNLLNCFNLQIKVHSRNWVITFTKVSKNVHTSLYEEFEKIERILFQYSMIFIC